MSQASHPTVAALKRIAATLLAMTQTRFEMAGIELIEEKNRLLSQVFTGLAAVLFMSFGVMVLTFMVAAHFWDSYRITALLSIALVYLGLGGFFWWKMKTLVDEAPAPFQATLAEIAKDRDAILRSASSDDGQLGEGQS